MAEGAPRWPRSPDFMASLAGFVGIVFAEISYFTRCFVVTVLALPEKFDMASVVKGNVSVFGREYHRVRSLDDWNINQQNNQQGSDPFHDESPLAGYHEFLRYAGYCG